MDKFVIRKPTKRASADCVHDSDTELQPPEKVAAVSSESTRPSGKMKMHTYKGKLTYDAGWKKKHPWMDYDTQLKGMVCTVCKVYGKAPVQARGAWVTRPVDNWVKATALLTKHEKSDWHLAAVEKRALSQSAEEHGDVVEQIVRASDEEKKQNCETVKKLIRSLYFLVKHHIPTPPHLTVLLPCKLRMETSSSKLTEKHAHAMQPTSHMLLL